MPVPALYLVETMSHKELIRTLRYCPWSKYFLEDRTVLSRGTVSREAARDLLLEMISEYTSQNLPAIMEKSSKYEQSQHHSEKKFLCDKGIKQLAADDNDFANEPAGQA